MKTALAFVAGALLSLRKGGASASQIPPKRPQGRARDRRGQTLVEYAMIISVIIIVVIGVLLTLGQQTQAFYTTVTSQLGRWTPPGS